MKINTPNPLTSTQCVWCVSWFSQGDIAAGLDNHRQGHPSHPILPSLYDLLEAGDIFTHIKYCGSVCCKLSVECWEVIGYPISTVSDIDIEEVGPGYGENVGFLSIHDHKVRHGNRS